MFCDNIIGKKMVLKVFISAQHVLTSLPLSKVLHHGAQRLMSLGCLELANLVVTNSNSCLLLSKRFLQALYQTDTWDKSKWCRKRSIWSARTPNAPLIETVPTPGSFKRSWGRTYLNVKQLLDKGRETHRYLDVLSRAWDQKKKKIQRGGGIKGGDLSEKWQQTPQGRQL